jgi:4-methylaminobutanoate oxidase (formaldehyde-forming)
VRPPWFDRLREEHEAFRDRVGIIDLSSFGKIEVAGGGALALLERVCDNRVDRPVGGIVYTQFLNERGGIVGDVTVTRLSDDRFRVTTGSAAVNADLGWLRMHERVEDGPVELRDGSEDLSVLGLWGPLARDVLASVTESDVSNEAFPYLSTLELRVGPAPVFAQRISWVGELGWELWVEPRWAVAAWDRLVDAGRAHGLEPCGYRVLEGLRSERGYRAFGSDLTAGDTPDEAGLSFCVDVSKDFVGRPAILATREAGPETRLRTLLVGDQDYAPIYGGEAVYLDGRVTGRVRSCAYGFTVGRNIAFAYLPADLGDGPIEVEVFGDLVAAEVVTDVPLDPEGKRVRG